jgi:ParB/RepB/Spo0J family partition protein
VNQRESQLKISVDAVKTEKHFNPRYRVDQSEVAALASSLQSQLGQISPIIVREGDNELVDGLHRLLAAKRVGKPVEAIKIKVTDQMAKEMALVANSLTQKLNWLERGRAVAEILDGIKWRGGRERKKRELAKQLGITHHILEQDASGYRLLAHEAWEICLALSKKHLLSRVQISRIWQLQQSQQLALLRRIERMKDPVEIDQHVEAFLATQQVERNVRGRPRRSGTSKPSVEFSGPEKTAAPQEENHQDSSVKSSKRERTGEKLQEALRMDPVDMSTLHVWKLLVLLEPRLREYSQLSCERWKVVEALQRDLQLLDQKAESREPRTLTVVSQSKT